MQRTLYVSFVRQGIFGSAFVPLLGPLSEYAIGQITRAVASQAGALPIEIVIVAITVLEDYR